MSTRLAASPATEAAYGAWLLDATLMALLTGGIYDDVPQDPSYPFGWFEVAEETDGRGLGTGTLNMIDLRLHVFTTAAGKAQGQAAADRAVAVLKDAALTISGWTHCDRVFWDRTVAIPDGEMNGVKVHELIAYFRIYAEA